MPTMVSGSFACSTGELSSAFLMFPHSHEREQNKSLLAILYQGQSSFEMPKCMHAMLFLNGQRAEPGVSFH